MTADALYFFWLFSFFLINMQSLREISLFVNFVVQ